MKSLKKLVKQAIKPDEAFDDWAAKNNVDLSAMQSQKNRRRLTNKWIAVTASIVLVFAAFIPMIFHAINSENNDPGQIEQPVEPKKYTALDSNAEIITLEDLYAKIDILLFDIYQIADYRGVFEDVVINNKDIRLSLTINNALLLLSDEANAFYVDYKIRTYKHYEFYTIYDYENLDNDFLVSETKVNYKIQEELGVRSAFLSFTFNELDYFLQVREFEGITEITEANLKLLLQDLIPPISAND